MDTGWTSGFDSLQGQEVFSSQNIQISPGERSAGGKVNPSYNNEVHNVGNLASTILMYLYGVVASCAT